MISWRFHSFCPDSYHLDEDLLSFARRIFRLLNRGNTHDAHMKGDILLGLMIPLLVDPSPENFRSQLDTLRRLSGAGYLAVERRDGKDLLLTEFYGGFHTISSGKVAEERAHKIGRGQIPDRPDANS